MAVLSKEEMKFMPFMESVPYTCYEVAHCWEPSCIRAFLDTMRDSFKFSLKVYITFYSAAALLNMKKKKKKGLGEVIKFCREILQSSIFLSSNGTIFLGMFCVIRHLFGKFHGWHGLAAGFIAGYISILMERKSRRGALALYLLNLTTEILFNMAVSRGKLNTIPNGEVFLFCVASAGFMLLYRKRGGLSDSLQKSISLLVGKYEAPGPHPLTQERYTLMQRVKKSLPKHTTCCHDGGCLYYVLEGGCKQFAIGYLIEFALNLLKFIRKRKEPLSTLFRNFSLASFLGLYSFLFRTCNCLLRWVSNQDHPALYGSISGAVAGLSSFFYKSSTISLYALFKLFELFWCKTYKIVVDVSEDCATSLHQILTLKAVDAGYIPSVPNFDSFLYASSLAIILHTSCCEPHNIRPGYWKFLCGVSGNKFPGMFRQLLDVFGTKASTLYPSFIPDLKPESVKSKDVIRMMIASGKWKGSAF